MVEKIRLRGHHIDSIAKKLFNRNMAQRFTNSSISYIENSPIDSNLNNLLKSYDSDVKVESRPTLGIYTDQTEDDIHDIYDKILTNPDLQIEIVEGIDSICESCNNRPGSNERRISKPFYDIANDDDKISLEEFGLELGRTYLASEIIELIKTYQERTDMISPIDGMRNY